MRKSIFLFLILVLILLLIADYFLYEQKKEKQEKFIKMIIEEQEKQLKESKLLKYEIIEKEELADHRIKISILLPKNCSKDDAEKYVRAAAKGYPGKLILAYLDKNDKKPYVVYTFGRGDRRHPPIDDVRFHEFVRKKEWSK